MAYTRDVINTVLNQLQARRQRDETALAERKLKIHSEIPALQALNTEWRSILSSLLTLSSDDDSATKQIKALKQKTQRIQTERGTLLQKHGYPTDLFDLPIYCPLCKDSLVYAGKTCSCVESLYAQEQRKRLSQMLDLRGQTFDTFRLSYYSSQPDAARGMSPAENAELIYQYCRDYATHFSSQSSSLLMIGKPGLGKTFLSAAIAGEVSKAGYAVVYDSVTTIISVMEGEKFDRNDESEGSAKYLHCDLLILDDLGTEMNTPFAQSALYRLVNHRLTKELPTIVSTNLSKDELSRRYQASLTSRLLGAFEVLYFWGEDIRLLKKKASDPD